VATVLIIDDNEAVRRALELLYSLHDMDTLSAGAPLEGLALLDRRDVDLVVQDMNFTRRGADRHVRIRPRNAA